MHSKGDKYAKFKNEIKSIGQKVNYLDGLFQNIYSVCQSHNSGTMPPLMVCGDLPETCLYIWSISV